MRAGGVRGPEGAEEWGRGEKGRIVVEGRSSFEGQSAGVRTLNACRSHRAAQEEAREFRSTCGSSHTHAAQMEVAVTDRQASETVRQPRDKAVRNAREVAPRAGDGLPRREASHSLRSSTSVILSRHRAAAASVHRDRSCYSWLYWADPPNYIGVPKVF